MRRFGRGWLALGVLAAWMGSTPVKAQEVEVSVGIASASSDAPR
jgi:hypothetical protein